MIQHLLKIRFYDYFIDRKTASISTITIEKPLLNLPLSKQILCQCYPIDRKNAVYDTPLIEKTQFMIENPFLILKKVLHKADSSKKHVCNIKIVCCLVIFKNIGNLTQLTVQPPRFDFRCCLIMIDKKENA